MLNFSSPYINHFIQPDSIVPNPSNPQNLNRFGYVLNNPVNLIDPSGHVCVNNGGTNDEVAMPGNCNGDPDPGYTGGLQGPNWPEPDEEDDPDIQPVPNINTVYIGGSTPAEIPGFSTQEQVYLDGGDPSQRYDVFEEFNYFYNAFNAGKKPASLNLYLSYSLIEGKIYNMSLTAENHGATSGKLNFIEIKTERFVSLNSCTKNEICTFYPSKPIYFEPKNITTLNICTNCLNTNTFSMPGPMH